MATAKVFVGGLSWETDEQSLRDYFAQYGPVSDCVIMRDRLTGHPRGFGFVTYDDQLVAERVAAEFHELDGRQVEAKMAVPRSECVPAVRTNAWRATKKVFVGGLPATCRETELHAHFSRFGDIAECQVMYDHQTGNSRGFGFVTFTSEHTVDRVVDMEVHEIMAKHVEVKRAEPKQALEARRGREAAAAAAAAVSHSLAPPQSLLMAPAKPMSSPATASSTTFAPAAAAAAAAAASTGSAQPRVSSAPSLPFPNGLTQSAGTAGSGNGIGPRGTGGLHSPFGSLTPWSSFFPSGASNGWNGGTGSNGKQRETQAAAVRPVLGGTGFFTPGQSYSGELGQCAYAAFYAASAPGDGGSGDVGGGLPPARLERRFHPYSNRERIERSYR